MTIGELYAALKPVLYPQGLPDRAAQNRDVNVLKRLLKGYTAEEILMCAQGLRDRADRGEAQGWVEAGENFSARALLTATPMLLAESRKAPAAPRADSGGPVSLSSLLGEFLS